MYTVYAQVVLALWFRTLDSVTIVREERPEKLCTKKLSCENYSRSRSVLWIALRSALFACTGTFRYIHFQLIFISGFLFPFFRELRRFYDVNFLFSQCSNFNLVSNFISSLLILYGVVWPRVLTNFYSFLILLCCHRATEKNRCVISFPEILSP